MSIGYKPSARQPRRARREAPAVAMTNQSDNSTRLFIAIVNSYIMYRCVCLTQLITYTTPAVDLMHIHTNVKVSVTILGCLSPSHIYKVQ